ncbi:MAG: hypothetical protein ACR2O1_13745 [Boseongicola sp.]
MRLALALFFSLFGTIAAAEPPLTEGTFRFGHNAESNDNVAEFTSLTTYRFGGAAMEGRFELGVSRDASREAHYASAGISVPFGTVDIGRPRSILELGPIPDQVRYGSIATRSALRPLAAEAALDDTLGGGIRIIGENGSLRVGTSYHLISETNDSVFGVAGRYDLEKLGNVDQITFYGGAESDGLEEHFLLGTEVTSGNAIAAVDLLRGSENGGIQVSQISLGYAVSNNLTLGISGFREFEEATDSEELRLGLGASVMSGTGAYVRGGIDGASSDDIAFDLAIGFQF